MMTVTNLPDKPSNQLPLTLKTINEQLLAPHGDNREAVKFIGLHQGDHFEGLVERPRAARQNDKGRRILNQHHLTDEKVLELDKLVEDANDQLMLSCVVDCLGNGTRFRAPLVTDSNGDEYETR